MGSTLDFRVYFLKSVQSAMELLSVFWRKRKINVNSEIPQDATLLFSQLLLLPSPLPLSSPDPLPTLHKGIQPLRCNLKVILKLAPLGNPFFLVHTVHQVPYHTLQQGRLEGWCIVCVWIVCVCGLCVCGLESQNPFQ